MLKGKFGRRLFVILTIIGLLTACSSQGETTQTISSNANTPPDAKKTIVLKGVTAWEENNIHSAAFGMFKKKVEELSDGRIAMEYAGGPEAVPSFNQGDAVRTGVVDLAILSTAYYQNQVPEAAVLNYSELTVEEEWNGGAMDFLNEIHNEKLNAQLIGRASGMGYSLYVKEPVKDSSELKGKRFRTSPAYVPFINALGAEAVVMPPGEIYTAIERGVIDGVAWPAAGITDLGLEQQVKYQILPLYWQVDTVIVMNLDTWKQLSKEDQDVINQAAREVEKELPVELSKFIESEQQKMKEAGVQQIELQDGEEYVKLSYDAAWEWLRSNLPENGPKLEELFRKQ